MQSLVKLREVARQREVPTTTKLVTTYVRPSSELRYWTERDIADAIEAAIGEIERELGERYMPLPLDANDVPVRLGDVLYAPEDGSMPFEVRAMRLDESGWTLYDRFGYGYRPRYTYHYRKPTVEDVLREMLQAAGCEHHEDGSCEMGLTHEQVAEYAARLRLAGDAE